MRLWVYIHSLSKPVCVIGFAQELGFCGQNMYRSLIQSSSNSWQVRHAFACLMYFGWINHYPMR